MTESTASVFTYGTLMLPEVMRAVTGVRAPHVPATLQGYKRALLHQRIYPGILPEAGSSVDGVLWRDLEPDHLFHLDEFEADEYQRQQVEVALPSGETVIAYAYVVAPSHAALLSDIPWDTDTFREQHLSRYLDWSQP